MFPAAMLALTMVVAVSMLAVAPPPQMSESDRARVASDALVLAQYRAMEHCRANPCPEGALSIPNVAGTMTPNVMLRRQADGTIVASWRHDVSPTNWSRWVATENLNLELERAAYRSKIAMSRVGPAERVAQTLSGGSTSGPPGGLTGSSMVELAGMQLPRRQPVIALRAN
jgi:hypothetical protein